MAADIKSMTLEQAKSYKQQLKDSGKTQSTSKEFGKLEDYIKTLTPEKYGDETVQSAYTKLSSGVTERGGWTEQNLPELNKRGIATMLDPVAGSGGAGDLTSQLSNYQDGVYGAAGSPELRDSIVQQIEPAGGQPDLLNRAETREEKREEMGVASLEATMNDLNAQLEEQYASKRARTNDALGKPVSLGVIGGRVSEIERQEMDRIDALGRQINVVNNQLTTAYNIISEYMSDTSLDYQDAVAKYNTEFNRNLQIYNLIDEEMDEQEATARANLQTYQNAILSGNLDYGSLSGNQKVAIARMEAQAGLPIGITSSLKVNPKDQILATSSDGSQVTFMRADGTFETVSTGITPKSTGTSADDKEEAKFDSAISDGIKRLKDSEPWETVWQSVHTRFPDVPNEVIDYSLGISWREGNAYEDYRDRKDPQDNNPYYNQ